MIWVQIAESHGFKKKKKKIFCFVYKAKSELALWGKGKFMGRNLDFSAEPCLGGESSRARVIRGLIRKPTVL